MANIAVLAPRVEMLAQAQAAARQLDIQLHYLQEIETPNAMAAAWEAVEAGAQVLVARGLQAQLIKQNTDIPLVEIRTTSQEMGLLVQRAKKLLGKRKPQIAVVGLANSFSSYIHFNELFDVIMKVYTTHSMDALQSMVQEAAEEGADLIIGGDTTMQAAERLGIPALFNETTEEAMVEALTIAQKAAFAIDVERKASIHLDAVLDTSLNGLVEIDPGHKITMVNQVVEDITGLRAGELVGRPLEGLIAGIDSPMIEDILQGRKERTTFPGRVQNIQLAIGAAPLSFDGDISGAIFTLHRMKTAGQMPSDRQHEMYRSGHIATVNFSQINRQNEAMRHCIETAKMYALSGSPVVIYGETGTETELLAQAIHNNSGRRNQPFISLNCFDTDPVAQAQFLFGNEQAAEDITRSGALYSANLGTVYISDIQNLLPVSQFRLYKLIRSKSLIRNNIDKAMTLDVRILCSARQNLALLVQNGSFREDLYHLLAPLQLNVPPLRNCAEDIQRLAKEHVKTYCDRYSKYVDLSKQAYAFLALQQWPGNLLQLEHFCELLVLTATSRRLEEGYVRNMFADTYPAIHATQEGAKVTVYKHPEALEIAQALARHHGNRQAAAEELGVSTTTLWRRIKKYGIEEMYKA